MSNTPDPTEKKICTTFLNYFAEKLGKIFKSIKRPWVIVGLLTGVTIATSRVYIHSEVYKDIAHEVSFAIFVSFAAYILFDASRSEEEENKWEQRIKNISDNVFYAVLGKDLPKDFVSETLDIALSHTLFRKNFEASYYFTSEVIDLDNGHKYEYVKVCACVEFSMENTSQNSQNYPIKLRLPNPIHSKLRDLVEIPQISVTKDGINLDVIKREEAEENFKSSLKNDTDTNCEYYYGDITIAPRDKVNIKFSYDMMKEEEDTEFLETGYPSDGMKITVNNIDPKWKIFGRSVHRSKLNIEPRESFSAIVFHIDRPILPHQGILWWWKKTFREN